MLRPGGRGAVVTFFVPKPSFGGGSQTPVCSLTVSQTQTTGTNLRNIKIFCTSPQGTFTDSISLLEWLSWPIVLDFSVKRDI